MSVLQREAVTDEILRLTLNRPKTLNALNKRLLRQLSSAFDDAEGEGRQVVVVSVGALALLDALGSNPWN